MDSSEASQIVETTMQDLYLAGDLRKDNELGWDENTFYQMADQLKLVMETYFYKEITDENR